MIEPSENLHNIFDHSLIVAKENSHEYVTIEHLLYSIVCDNESTEFLKSYGADADFLRQNLEHYIKHSLKDIKTDKDIKPRKTNLVERLLNRAFTHVLFSGRQKIEVPDIIASMLQEKNSFAYYFLN